MEKITLLVLLCFLSFTSIFAQNDFGNISFQHGAEIDQGKDQIIKISGQTSDRIYTLSKKKKKFFIKVFNSDKMELLSTNEIVLDDFKKYKTKFRRLVVLGENVYILASSFDKKEKQYNLFGYLVSKDGKVSGNRIDLFKTKVTKKSEKGNFYFRKSPNGESILVLHATLFDKEEVIQYEVKLLGKTLNVIASNLNKVPFKDRKGLEFSIQDYDVNYKNDFFLVINESYRDRKRKKNIEKFNLHSYKASNNYKKEEVNINFTNKEVINCELLANSNDEVQLVGFYSSVRKNGKANKELKGIYYAKIDVSSNEVKNLKFNEFDLATKIKLIGERRAKKGKDVKPLYRTHSIIEKEDGGLILLAEYHLVAATKKSGIGPMSAQSFIHNDNEIIVTSFNPDGTVAWANVVPKEQRGAYTAFGIGLGMIAASGSVTVSAGIELPLGVAGEGPEYLSAIPVYTDGKLIVIFNDNPKNKGVTEIKDIKRMTNYKTAVPTAFIFDENGNAKRIDQDGKDKKQLTLRPGIFYKVSPKEFIIYSSKKKSDKIGKMILK
ncbi:hypothetical protein [Aureivirga marina]|uniref:hypothetical protein n=1 Tax=Aureivirga marina TaxID=1182451 RepID=UPI0018C9EFBF|nr:hypothetical protein [Aureivirga marina]